MNLRLYPPDQLFLNVVGKNLNTNSHSKYDALTTPGLSVAVCVLLTFSHALRKQGAPTDQLRHGELGESALSWERSHTSTTIIISVSSTLRPRSRRLHQAYFYNCEAEPTHKKNYSITVLSEASLRSFGLDKAGVNFFHAELLSVNKIDLS